MNFYEPFEELNARLASIEAILREDRGKRPNDAGHTQPGENAQFITKRDAARLLGCSTGTIDNLARAGRLKRHYVGRSVRFFRSQVLDQAKPLT